ncbi:hypothetical protein [Nocardioides limicola]|uniref:hypothetical protein n=1 Tax=Nocardioides limicola TaxID=2803368 RepID=UPI00193B7853|nr:hypothetical protein [Nocardioides sp. DJM-14]
MPGIVATSEETRQDEVRYTQARLVEVACLDCLARVGVKKNSDHHTQIQWSSAALADCAEFRRAETRPEGRDVKAACPRLRASIDAAVQSGEIVIGAEDGY